MLDELHPVEMGVQVPVRVKQIANELVAFHLVSPNRSPEGVAEALGVGGAKRFERLHSMPISAVPVVIRQSGTG